MSPPAYTLELEMATAAVLKASLLAQKVQAELVGSGGVTKSDKSPVTGEHTLTQPPVQPRPWPAFPPGLGPRRMQLNWAGVG